jgi:class 3 adenylate cyclase
MNDYFDILRDDMLANYKAAQNRAAKIREGRLNPLPNNLLVGETNEYYTSILCFDIVKFSDLTRTGSDNPSASLLSNTVMPTVMKVLSDFNGITLTVAGDQSTTLFGLEGEAASGGAKSALQAALFITNFIEHIADRFIGKLLPNGLRCSIGIDQGPVHITMVGRSGTKSLVPLGPPVHIAQNLHFLAGDNEIWVGENFYRSLDPDFVNEYLSEAPVGNWPWISTETGEVYRAFRFVE